MNSYEMIAILSPQLESEEIDEAIEKISNAISQNGGTDEISSLKAVSYTHLTLPTTPYV